MDDAPVQREELLAVVSAGDDRLRDHIDQQIKTVAATVTAVDLQTSLALTAAEKLEITRITAIEQRLNALDAEREITAAALRSGAERSIADSYGRLDDKIDAVRELLLTMIAAKAAEFEAIHNASQTAIAKAEDSIQRRLDLLNESRQQISDYAATYAQREVVDAQIGEVRRHLADLTDKVGKLL